MAIGMGGAIGKGGQMAIGMGGKGAAAPGTMTRLCKFFEAGGCPQGRACTFAHGWQELNGGASAGIGMKGGKGFNPLAGMPLAFAGGDKGKSKGKGRLKTKLCQFFEGGTCQRSSEECSFAHGEEELVPSRRKTRLCQFFESGACTKGEDCGFAHGEHELQPFEEAGLEGLEEAQPGADEVLFDEVFDEAVDENQFGTFDEASFNL